MLHNRQSTILIVEDNRDKSELTAYILCQAGYSVLTAFDGREGLEVALRELPDLILSDVSMPVMDGIELCRLARSKKHLRTTPIMLITALRKGTESMAEGLAAGADDYLETPYEPQRLVAKVARLIERKRAEEPLSRFVSLVENSDDAIIGKTLDGIITSWNYGAERTYGYSAEEMLGQTVDVIVPEDRREELRGIYNGLRKGLRVNNFQTKRVRKDGALIDVSLTVSPITDTHDRVIGVSSVARDITERALVQAERERLVKELRAALAEVKTLRGILPICMNCKKIRDDEGAWTKLEIYIREHTSADFSHGICETCAGEIYPGVCQSREVDRNKNGGR
jgi:PAS domain S-box-containing protein